MKHIWKIIVVVVLVAAVGVVVALKQSGPSAGQKAPAGEAVETPAQGTGAAMPDDSRAQAHPVALPRLVEFGGSKCVACKQMEPILESLKEEYAGRLEVAVVDVLASRDLARMYGIQLIPTQVFYDAEGRELYRHQGAISKNEILATWKRLGVDLSAPARPE